MLLIAGKHWYCIQHSHTIIYINLTIYILDDGFAISIIAFRCYRITHDNYPRYAEITNLDTFWPEGFLQHDKQPGLPKFRSTKYYNDLKHQSWFYFVIAPHYYNCSTQIMRHLRQYVSCLHGDSAYLSA